MATSVAASEEYSFIAEASANEIVLPARCFSIAEKTMFCTLIRAISILASLSWMSWTADLLAPEHAALGVVTQSRWHSFDDAERQRGHPDAFHGETERTSPLLSPSTGSRSPSSRSRPKPDVVEEELPRWARTSCPSS